MKQAIFPDQKSLQPIPTANGAHANISGNTNSSVGFSPDLDSTPGTTTDTPTAVSDATITESGHSLGFYILWIIAVLIIGSALFYIVQNRIKR